MRIRSWRCESETGTALSLRAAGERPAWATEPTEDQPVVGPGRTGGPVPKSVGANERGYVGSGRRLHELPVLRLAHDVPVDPQRAVAHVALRPLWICRACADPWPCATARLLLKGQYDQNPIGLSVHLRGVLHEAIRDLYRLNACDAPAPQAMFERFVGWAPYRRPIVP
jgi:hypothetical protein